MSLRRWLVLSAALIFALAGAATLAFPSWVRASAQSRAENLGLLLSVGSVRPAWLGARLNDISITIPDVPGASLHLDQIVVASDSSVHASGGQLALTGSLEDLQEQVARWRAARATHNDHAGGAPRPPVELQNIAVSWVDPLGPQTSLNASGASTPDLRHLTTVRFASVVLQKPGYAVRATNLSLQWVRGASTLLRLVQAGEVHAELDWGPVADDIGPAAPIASASAPPATSGRPPPIAAPPVIGPSGEVPFGARLDGWKKKAADALRGMAGRVHDDARLEVGALEIKVRRGSDHLTLGPGPFEASRDDGRLVMSLSPGASAGQTGVTFRLELPLVGAGDTKMDIVGGPIGLSTLGVRDGDLGLTLIDKASLQVNLHLLVKADGASVEFDGSIAAKELSIAHPKLAEVAVEGLAVAARVKGTVRTDGTRLELGESEFDVGAVQLEVAGTVDRSNNLAVDLRFGIPMVSCQAFLDALPTALIPVVKGMSSAGTLSLKGRLRFDPARPSDFLLDYQAANDCRITSVPPGVDVTRFREPFRRSVYGPGGKRVEIESGPGTPGWSSLNAMSRYLEVAVMTTEDGRFRTHRGFDHEAIRNSVRENLIQRRFVRGASTISMQLAKNLYLDRHKTVSRKLQELILTSYLEQALTKDQILELYLNIIEFGPMVYGAGPAAYHYFHTSPSALSLGQALYLSSILPNPAQQHFASGGRVSDGWMNYLHKLMKNAERRRWIGTDELEEGLGEWVVYGSPEPIRTTPTDGTADTAGDEAVDPNDRDSDATP